MNPSAWHTNQLAGASSPYLRQHAGNPVHWQQWNVATLVHARDTDTPILLSIGYSACHWCHVMARECFEVTAIAEVMNARFINIKLDREERPDIDHMYQLAHQALAGRGGGWPLTVFLDPQDLAPFYIGTYFPPTAGRGLPAFPDVLVRGREFFDGHRDELRGQAGRLRAWLAQLEARAGGDLPRAAHVQATVLQRLTDDYDATWGGQRGAPKFPHATQLGWLLDTADPEAHAMARHTLAMMARRGLHDQLGGGFFRYTVDAAWTIPHFEKMLYDNAQLLPLYARLAADPGVDPTLRATAGAAARGIADWLARDLGAPDGAFYSSLDADSEHQEGKYYLWSREQLATAAGSDDAALAAAAYGLDAPPNFEGRAWHLLRVATLDVLAAQVHAAPEAITSRIAALRGRLLAARSQRVPPGRDDKVLTAWNAATIAGLARAARALGDARFTTMAARALDALRDAAWIDAALYANAAAADARIPGFLDDHAPLLDALLEVLQLRFDRRDLDWAIAIADALLEKFEDRAAGGFWIAAEDHATPLGRGRNLSDDALPNGYAIATLSLLRLGDLLGDARYLAAAERALRAAAGALAQYPEACPSLLRALAEYDQPRRLVVVRCPAAEDAAWRGALATPDRSPGPMDAFVIPTDAAGLPGILAQRTQRAGAGTAYVCAGVACQAPLDSPAALTAALREAAS